MEVQGTPSFLLEAGRRRSLLRPQSCQVSVSLDYSLSHLDRRQRLSLQLPLHIRPYDDLQSFSAGMPGTTDEKTSSLGLEIVIPK